MSYNYFYGQSGELFSYFRIPKALFQDRRFRQLSTDARTLYGILLDRMSLSAKNDWLDEQGRVYIVYTVREVQESLCCAEHKAVKLFRELEDIDLIERKRRGLGRPSLVYVKDFSSGLPKAQVQNCPNSNSGAAESAILEQPKPQANKTDKNKTEWNDPDPIYSGGIREQLEDYFYQSLEVDLLLRLCPDDEDAIYQIVDLLVDAFIIATHTDREHIHNHIIYNSTALDSTRKFRDFLLSGLAVQRLSDLICLEHQLSVIEIKPYRERQKRTLYPPRESNRDKLCAVIDNILLSEKPASFEGFLQKLEQRGYEIKRGKYTSVKGTRQKRFIRFRTLGAGYSEDEIKAVIAGDAEHCPHQKQPPKEQPFHLLVDIQAKLSEGKSEGYARWAKKYNLKEMSKTLIFLQEKKIGSIKEMQERVDAATARYHELGDSIKAAETRMAEIAVLRTHIVNYAKTRPVYDAYRKAGYSKRFLENHRAEITLHKAAKAAFDESNLKTLPKVKELDAEYSKLLTEKKALYPDYRKAKDEMQELLRAQRNVELFFAEEKNTTEKTQSR